MTRHWLTGLTRKPTHSPRRSQPGLEALEDRCVPAVIDVNSLADVVNPGPGVVTLRSAIRQANANGDASNTINLKLPGAYTIALAGAPNEADNAAGEFAITAAKGLTIQNASGGAVQIDGAGLNRVFDINPGAENNTPFTVTFQGLTVQHGVASAGDGDQGSGGGIRAQGAASVVLDGVSLLNNTATADGGGIVMESVNNDSVGALTITNSVISNNHAGDAGGGVESDGAGQVTITSTAVSNNTCINQGAGIWLDNGSAALSLTGDTISGNVAVTGLGGGVGNAGSGAVTITRSTVSNNFSGATGGGFGDAAGKGDLTVADSFFLNNTAAGDGGGVQEGGPSTSVSGALFEGNVSGGKGGGLFVNGRSVNVTGSVFRHNVAVNGGAVEAESDGFFATSDTFEANRAQGENGDNGNAAGPGGSGGAVEVQSNGASAPNVLFANSLFLRNAARNAINGNGGAIAMLAGSLEVAECQLTGNSTGGMGGAVYASGDTLGVFGSTFDGNRADGYGGAIYVITNAAWVKLSTLVGNSAIGYGGAIHAAVGNGLTLLADTINGNSTRENGGGIFNLDSLIIGDSIVAGNPAGGGADVTGGGITDEGGNLIGATTAGFGAGTLTGVDPKLGPLADNGGVLAGDPAGQQVIQTEALLAGSPAIGAGKAGVSGVNLDERFAPSPAGGRTDPSIGAFEPQTLAATTVTLTSSMNPAPVGNPVTLTAAVTGKVANASTGTSFVPHGSVTFTVDGKTQIVAPLVNGVASVTLSALTPTKHTITAAFSGDVNFAAGTATLAQVVRKLDDVTGVVRVDRVGPPTRHGNLVKQAVKLTNRSGQPIQGPLYLVIDGLTGGVRLTGAAGVTKTHARPGDAYVKLSAGQLRPGQSVMLNLAFNAPTRLPVRFTTFVFAGLGVL